MPMYKVYPVLVVSQEIEVEAGSPQDAIIEAYKQNENCRLMGMEIEGNILAYVDEEISVVNEDNEVEALMPVVDNHKKRAVLQFPVLARGK